MTGLEIAMIAFALMLLAIFLRLPIGLAMGLTGFFGVWYVMGTPNAPLSQLKTLSYDTFSSYSLSIVPLFLLMGQFATKSGMSAALFEAASDWMGHRKGGVAMAAVGACAGFGAVCGSSLATASTMGQVALPEMRKRGYSNDLATGVLAAGGTLGILIPPSIILVIYAILTEQNIVKMFIAALVPGLLAAAGYMLTVALYVRWKPDSATTAERVPFAQRFRTLLKIWPVVLIFGLVMGGIAADWNWAKDGVQALFTPTEGAAVGAVATGFYGIMTGGLTFQTFMVLSIMLIAYLVFGCVMDSLSMILLTIPIFYPIVETLDFGLTAEQAGIWFGILALIVVEVGLITPPVGMNLFIINSMARDIPMISTYRGVAPFVLSDLVRVVILVAFPGITLWLVGVMF